MADLVEDETARIQRDPLFQELVRKRGAYSWTLFTIMVVIYFGFIYVCALRRDITGIEIGGGITLAFPLALFVILAAIALTGLYVARANSTYDELTRRIVANAR